MFAYSFKEPEIKPLTTVVDGFDDDNGQNACAVNRYLITSYEYRHK